MAKVLTIKVSAKSDIEAYRIVSRLGFRFDVKEATYSGKTFKFDKVKKNSNTKDFLKDHFGKDKNE